MNAKEPNLKKIVVMAACLWAGGLAMAGPAAAAEELPIDVCYYRQEEDITLKEPDFNTGTKWEMLYAKEGMDVFSDVVPLPDGSMVAGGTFTSNPEDKIFHPLLIKRDARGKILWETRVATPEYRTIQRMLKKGEGFFIAGVVKDAKGRQGIYTALYDANGFLPGGGVPVKKAQADVTKGQTEISKTQPVETKKTVEKPVLVKPGKTGPSLFEKGGALEVRAMVEAADASGYFIAAQFIDEENPARQHAILFKVSKQGALLWKRSYQPGMSTAFNGMHAMLDGGYMLTGQLVLEDGRAGGWAVKVDGKGTIQWQQVYRRGMAAVLQAAGQTQDGGYILTGKIKGGREDQIQKDTTSAWVMKVNQDGNPVWQRYFSGDYKYDAPDVLLYADGRTDVLVGAQSLMQTRSHVRLITFSPLGGVMQVADYTDGQNAYATRLLMGPGGERLFTGYVQTSFGEKQAVDEPAPVYTLDAWLAATAPLELYQDPCAQRAASGLLP